MIEPKVRLTLHLPPKLHQLIQEAARAEYARPAEYAKRILAERVNGSTTNREGAAK